MRDIPEDDSRRTGHALGNAMFNRMAGLLFGSPFTGIFSGYQAFSRRFVASFPVLSDGFERCVKCSAEKAAQARRIMKIPERSVFE